MIAVDYLASRFVEEGYINSLKTDLGDKARMVAITLVRSAMRPTSGSWSMWPRRSAGG
ncbi:MAG: hypothetical protein JNL98_35425 [Bryobacterales bacterium]|nr:hypothetical protein [Bryobacterales bacterium]